MSDSFTTPEDASIFSATSSPPSSVASDNFDVSLKSVDSALLNCLLAAIDLQAVHDTLVSVARDAGEMMIAADPSVETSDSKRNTSDRVTETDKQIEHMVKSRLEAAYPEFMFLGEETFKDGQKLSDDPTFVCDPIDGTLNFIHGFPNTAVSLALAVAKRPVVGVVYNPFRRDLFSAVKGHGAFWTRANGSSLPLPIKQAPDALASLNGCLVALEWGSERRGPNWEVRTRTAQTLLSAKAAGGAMVHSVRSSGSAALDFCYVAAGWLDLFWEGGCWIWDVAAGWCILEEAGGLVAGANPGEWEPSLEGRSYLAVRGAPRGQEGVVEELWGCMGGRRFVFE